MKESSNDLRARIRRLHGLVLADLRDRITHDIDELVAVGPRRGPVGIPALVVLAAVDDPSAEIHVSVGSVPIGRLTEFTGHYPPRSQMIAISVHARHSRTGRPIPLPPEEADAWASALTSPGYENHTVRLGVLTGSTSGAVHYRYILGPDHHPCMLDPHDHATLTDNHRYH